MAEQRFTVAVETLSVSLLPVDNPDRRHYELRVNRRPGDRWVVTTHHGDLLNTAGEWSHGADVDDAWKAEHWHTYETAIRLANEACRLIVVNGRTATEALRTAEVRDAH
jgi:hypothetical protein